MTVKVTPEHVDPVSAHCIDATTRFDVLRDACRSLRLGVVTESNHLHLSLGAS